MNTDPDPGKNPFWPIPGHFEEAVYGQHDMATKPGWRAVFRRHQFVLGASSLEQVGSMVEPPPEIPGLGDLIAPWGLSDTCGRFVPEAKVADDPLGEASAWIDDQLGKKGSIWVVERKLREGVDMLRVQALGVVPGTYKVEGRKAFAWLWSQRVVRQVWRELAVAIVTDAVFNRAPPAAGCDHTNPYPLDPVPRRTYAALGWALPGEAVSDAEAASQGEIGVFNTDALPEHDGLDLQTLMGWENRHGACVAPTTWHDKFPGAQPGYTSCKGRCGGGGGEYGFQCFCDGSCALFDDCCADFEASCELDVSAAPGGDTLDQLEAAALAAGRRARLAAADAPLLWVLLKSPQYLMTGATPAKSDNAEPTLAPPDASYAAACATLVGPAQEAGHALQCSAGSLAISPL